MLPRLIGGMLLWAAASVADARPVHYPAELALDAALITTAVAISRSAPERGRWERGRFPSDDFDEHMHGILHGSTRSAGTTEREERLRRMSDVTVVSSVALPVGMAVVAGGEPLMGRLATTTHAMLASNTLVTAVKYAVRRPRPKPHFDDELSAAGDASLSFPSGHSAAAFTGAGLVGTLFPDTSWPVRTGAYALAGFTAFARIAGDKHFFTDVVVGALLGSASAHLVSRQFAEVGEGAHEPGLSIQMRANMLVVEKRF